MRPGGRSSSRTAARRAIASREHAVGLTSCAVEQRCGHDRDRPAPLRSDGGDRHPHTMRSSRRIGGRGEIAGRPDLDEIERLDAGAGERIPDTGRGAGLASASAFHSTSRSSAARNGRPYPGPRGSDRARCGRVARAARNARSSRLSTMECSSGLREPRVRRPGWRCWFRRGGPSECSSARGGRRRGGEPVAWPRDAGVSSPQAHDRGLAVYPYTVDDRRA